MDAICRPGDHDYVVPGSKEYREHLGCSEVADILGWGYGTPQKLFMKKTGKAPATEHKAIFDRGHDMEPVMARMVRDKGRILVGEQVQYRDPDRPWLIYHADGMFPKWSPLEEGDEPRAGAGIWEAKAPGGPMVAEMARNGMTKGYVCQGQTGMYIATKALEQVIQWGTFGYLDYDDYDLVAFDVAVNPDFQSKALAAIDEFWDYVVRDIMPPDLSEIEKVEPPVVQGKLEVITDPDAAEVAHRLAALMEQAKEIKTASDIMRDSLKKICDPYAIAEIPGVMKFSYKYGKDKEVYDGPGLVAYVEHLLEKVHQMASGGVVVAPDFNRSHFVTTKPGTRRFVPTPIKE